MRATIPDNLPQDLVDACRVAVDRLGLFTAMMQGLKDRFPAQADRLDRIVGEVNQFIDQAEVEPGVTLGQLLLAVELRAGGNG